MGLSINFRVKFMITLLNWGAFLIPLTKTVGYINFRNTLDVFQRLCNVYRNER